MVTIEICIGSSCYVKGSNQLVEMVKQMIIDNNWQEKVVLKGSFCMGVCAQGLGVKINGNILQGIGLHNAKDEITKEVTQNLL